MDHYFYFYLQIPKFQIYIGFILKKTDVFTPVYRIISSYEESFVICSHGLDIHQHTTVESVLLFLKGKLPITKDLAVKLWLRFKGKKPVPLPPPQIWTKRILDTTHYQNSIIIRKQQYKVMEKILPSEIVDIIMSYVPNKKKYTYMPYIAQWHKFDDESDEIYVSDSD